MVHKLTLDEFKQVAEEAHLVCFNQLRPRDKNTFDFALVVENSEGQPISYATCIEMDKDTIYMQHGGAFPNIAKSARVLTAYHSIINFLREQYKRASTIINAQNTAMIKLAWTAGFSIHGADVMTDGVWLHLMSEFEK